MSYWFTADYHLGHNNIITYCKRPFKSLTQMNETIIRNHNNRVKPNDTVFFVGDFCFKNTSGGKEGEGELHTANFWLKKLNGRFVFIRGNHDKNNSLKTIIEYVVIHYGGQDICLVHNPQDYKPYFKINFVGHVHEKWKFKKLKNGALLVNVGVDVWKFMPVDYNEIMKGYEKWKKGKKNETKIRK